MNYTEITVAGTTAKVPAAEVSGKTIVVTGRWLKIASIRDEDWQEGDVVLPPSELLAGIQKLRTLGADIFTFSQKPSDPRPRYSYHYEWDSVAAIRTESYSDWWNKRVSTDLRCDVRKAAKLGVVVRQVPFDDELVRGIKEIYDETPIRQGTPFWHYRKDFSAVKQANATYVDQSEFLGAYYGDELIGFVKIVFIGRIARLMQIIAKDTHRDKRPSNALIAKAVGLCEEKGCTLLTYGKYQYTQGADSLTAFKRRNGFEEILVPKYYVPLTTTGKLALSLGLHCGAKRLVPASVLRSLKRLRASFYSRFGGAK